MSTAIEASGGRRWYAQPDDLIGRRRVPDLDRYCVKHGLKMITVADLIAYRRLHDKLVERVAEAQMPTKFGDFAVVGFRSLVDDKHHGLHGFS